MNQTGNRSRIRFFVLALLLLAIILGGVSTTIASNPIELEVIGTYESGIFDEGGAEIVVFDKDSQQLFVINSDDATVDILNISDPTQPTFVKAIDATLYGGGANSVAVHKGVVAVAIEAETATDPGFVVFFDADGNYLNQVTVGSLPDMVTFTPNGKYVLVANEGEPNDDYTIDPEGSVSIIDVRGDISQLSQQDVRTAGFTQFNNAKLDYSVRIFGPNATVAQDLEPEYIAVDPNSRYAYVAMQENNAAAMIDIRNARVLGIKGLGVKVHMLQGNGLDASDKDDEINIANWPVFGMYMPDGIAAYKHRGRTYIVTANEGDSRDYDGYSEEARVEDLELNPHFYPNAAELQERENLGRLNITTANGDFNNDGVYEALFSYGTRSFSIFTSRGRLVYDSGDDFEQIVAAEQPEYFNSNNDDNDSFESRSDNKGPEPEGVAVGKVNGRTYAFIGLERQGGIMVYDITKPHRSTFVQYINNRDFSGDPESGTAGDLGPEGITFISAKDSPTGAALLVVGNEVSGTTTIYSID